MSGKKRKNYRFNESERFYGRGKFNVGARSSFHALSCLSMRYRGIWPRLTDELGLLQTGGSECDMSTAPAHFPLYFSTHLENPPSCSHLPKSLIDKTFGKKVSSTPHNPRPHQSVKRLPIDSVNLSDSHSLFYTRFITRIRAPRPHHGENKTRKAQQHLQHPLRTPKRR